MVQSCVPIEFLKYIHIGLLCIQEDPLDRPIMSSIVVMLVSDTIMLPKPAQPAFSVGRFVGKSDKASSTSGKGSSINEVTLSNVIARWKFYNQFLFLLIYLSNDLYICRTSDYLKMSEEFISIFLWIYNSLNVFFL